MARTRGKRRKDGKTEGRKDPQAIPNTRKAGVARCAGPSVLPSFRPSVLLHLRLEAEHPPERQIVIPRRPILRQLGPIDPERQIQSGDEPRGTDAVLGADADTRIADEPDPACQGSIALVFEPVGEI